MKEEDEKLAREIVDKYSLSWVMRSEEALREAIIRTRKVTLLEAADRFRDADELSGRYIAEVFQEMAEEAQ